MSMMEGKGAVLSAALFRGRLSAKGVLVAAVALFAAGPARAATLEVGEGKTYSDIQSAIDAAVAETDEVLVYDGTYDITAQIAVTKAITVRSKNGAAVTTIRRANVDTSLENAAQRVLYVNHPGAKVVGFTLRGGFVWNATGSITDANHAYAYGAGAFIDTLGGTLSDCVVRENKIKRWALGGGVAALGASAVVTNCTVVDNRCEYGYSGAGTPRGVAVLLADGATLTDSLVASNNVTSTDYATAALYATSSRIIRSRLCFNRSMWNPGFYTTGNTTFEDTLIDHNFIARDGDNRAAGEIASGTSTFLRCTIADNTSAGSPGGFRCGGKAVFTDSVIQRNSTPTQLNANWSDPWNLICTNCLSDSVFPDTAVGCRTVLAPFVDAWSGDYRVPVGQPGYDIGARAFAYGTDVSAVVELSDTAIPGSTLSFTGVVYNTGSSAVEGRWSTDGGTTWTDYGSSLSYAIEDAAEGACTVSFQARVGGVERPVVSLSTRVSPTAYSVSTAEELVTAVRQARGGSVITVAAGTYDIAEELVLDEPVTLQSESGADETTINRTTVSKNWLTQRCLRLNHPGASADGFTFRGGLAEWQYAPGWADAWGSGVLIDERGGTLVNCTVTACHSKYWCRGAVAAFGASALVTNCTITANKATYGNGVGRVFGVGVAVLDGARVTQCRITDNNTSTKAYLYGGGAFLVSGSISHSLLSGNYSQWPAGGLYAKGGVVDNCVFARNNSADKGGGAYLEGGLLENCTFYGNVASSQGGGVYLANSNPRLKNCLFTGNSVGGTASDCDPDWRGSSSANTFSNCLGTVAFPEGSAGCKVGDALLKDPANGDYTPQSASAAVDAGAADVAAVTETDYANAPRLSGKSIDIGAVEYQVPEYELVCSVTGERLTAGSEVTITAVVNTQLSGDISCRWSLDGGETWTEWSTDLSFKHTFASYGDQGYSVQVRVGAKTMDAETKSVYIAPTDIYVVTSDRKAGEPAFPYATEKTAATNVLDAVAAGLSGSAINVGPGRHPVTNKIVLAANMSLIGTEGAEKTQVVRIRSGNLNDGEEQRCVYVNGAGTLVKGLAISGGAVRYTSGTWGAEKYGGGILIGAAGGTLDSCVISNNTASGYSYGAGLVSLGAALVTNCQFVANIGNYEGGGPTPTGGGAYVEGGTTFVDCDFRGNYASNSGDYERCNGAGLAVGKGGAKLLRCKIRNNTAGCSVRGGGVYVNTDGSDILLENCLIADNLAKKSTSGGGLYLGGTSAARAKIVNCTIANNSAGEGGGVYGNSAATFVNCIIHGNTVISDTSAGAPEWKGSGTYRTCFSTVDFPSGSTGCAKAASAGFTDGANGDYTLLVSSGAIDIGETAPSEATTTDVDLAHNPRVSGKATDMGCYEYQMPDFACDFTWTAERTVPGSPFAFKATVKTLEEGTLAYRWKFEDGEWSEWSSSDAATHSFSTYGNRAATLQVRVGETEHDAVSHVVLVSPTEVFVVDAAREPTVKPTFPYADRTTAATNLHTALTVAGGGSRIRVFPGLHYITNEIVVSSAIEIVGEEGADETLVVRVLAKPRGTADAHQRCFRIGHAKALVKGLAISGGDNYFSSDKDETMAYGAGVYIDTNGGTLDSCVVSNCTARDLACGGGVAVSGGASGLVTNCLIVANCGAYTTGGRAPFGGGVYLFGCATVVDTTVADNWSANGTYWCNCNGAGIFVAEGGGNIIRCTITNNFSGGANGAGIRINNGNAKVVNCLIARNRQFAVGGQCYGGGVYMTGGELINCTIVSNETFKGGGGVYVEWGTLQNCILQDNVRLDGDESDVEAHVGSGSFNHCLSPQTLPAKVGGEASGNIEGRSDFQKKHPFVPTHGSPAVNAGSVKGYEAYLVGGRDFYGKPRIVHRKIDIGCCENQSGGLTLIVR